MMVDTRLKTGVMIEHEDSAAPTIRDNCSRRLRLIDHAQTLLGD